MQAEIDELRKENKRLNSSNESYITLANTAYEISSTLRTENERLRSALHNAVSMIDSLNSAYGSDDVDAVAQAGRAALGGGGGGGGS
jgi:hypothetical protein